MDDELERIRAQLQAECEVAAQKRAKREAEKKRQEDYDRAWEHVICECNRMTQEPESTLELAPFEKLVKELAAWNRIEWLVEMRNNFRDQISRGLDTPARERRGELWFVESLLCLAKKRPARNKASELLHEFRVLPLCPFGPGSIACNVMEYFRHHLHAMEELRLQKQLEALEQAKPVVAELVKGKSTIRRNLQFKAWADGSQMKPAKIRDSWNRANQGSPIGTGGSGIEVVKKGILAARSFLQDLAARGFQLTAQQAIDCLPQQSNG